jgi:uncharacterized protein YhfF
MVQSVDPAQFADLPECEFGDPGPMRDALVRFVLAGTKTATSALVADYVGEDDPISRPGDRAVVVDTNGRRVAVIETTECWITTIALVDDQFAWDEGEGYAGKQEWRVAHEAFWNSYIDEIRRSIRDPTFSITAGTLIVAERFKLIARLGVTV